VDRESRNCFGIINDSDDFDDSDETQRWWEWNY